MTRPVGPVGPSNGAGVTPGVPDARDDDRRVGDRRSSERRSPSRRQSAGKQSADKDAAEPGRALVPTGERMTHDTSARAEPRPGDPARADAMFAVQMMGQQGQKRGLRGGAPVLDAARSTYLKTEYVGEKDRRPPTGSTKKTEL